MNLPINTNQIGMQMNYYNQTVPVHNPRSGYNTENVLFVADLPEEACEEDLANFFKSYNYTFSKVFHNMLRTHAFVTFDSRDNAERARNELNGVKISAKYATNKITKPVRLCRYETKGSDLLSDNTRTNLLIKNVSKEISAHSLFNIFRQFGDIKSCKLVVDYLGNSKGYGYVSFYKFEDAERALNLLNEKNIGGKSIRVNFLEHGKRIEKKKNNIYVKHIPKNNFNDEQLEKLFSQFGEIKSAVVLKDSNNCSKGFGFVCFERAEDAEEAYSNMNNKSIFNDLPCLYVNFAMKKSERLELLQKRREEMFKSAQRMTIFSKIKDENAVKNENDFEYQIRGYLKIIFNKEYEPKSVKIRFETKNAFITMNSELDAKMFIEKYNLFTKEHQTSLFFNLYKSKVERINSNSFFKKYNNFKNESTSKQFIQSQLQPRYKSYNQFNLNQSQEGVEYNTLSNHPSNFNFNFNNNPQYVSYNNFAQQQNVVQTSENRIDPNDEDSIGDYLYAVVEKFYPEHAAKITGMLMEFDRNRRYQWITSKHEELKKIVDSAYNQLSATNN